MAPESQRGVGLRQGLVAGLIAGVVAALAGVVTLLIMQAITGDSYPELTPLTVTGIALVANLAGGLLYAILTRFVARPMLWYAVIALVAATLDSLLSIVNPLHPGFGTIATPLHYVVAGISIALVPRLAARLAAR